MSQPLTYMERIASLERRIAEVERQLREMGSPRAIPVSLRMSPPPLMPMPHLDELRHPKEDTHG